jgi:methyl-accepting chemotaxis protein
VDGNLSNLADNDRFTNATSSEEKVEAHILDRVGLAAAVGGLGAFVALVVMFWSRIAAMAAAGGGWLLILMLLTLAVGAAAGFFVWYLSPMIGETNRELADVAEAMAAGDLSRTPTAVAQGGQLGRLGRAMVKMSAELADLATMMKDNAKETSRSATEITASTEHMAQAASGIAETASTLSEQATTMAETIRLLSLDAGRLTSLASTVNTGAAEGKVRNEKLKSLANENHELLNEALRRLDSLVSDVQESANAAQHLATASDQIRGFVTLVQKIARQSKLLALNAAMEASRAGEHGEGFSVVANEVRRLAASTSEAAEHTDQLIKDLIAQMETARAASARSLAAVETVRSATERGEAAFTQVERAVGEADQWVSTMASSAAAGNTFAHEITAKLDGLTSGTQAFANSMQDVAAASEQQSASTQEIAAAATSLVTAADKVSGTANRFRAAEKF